MEIVWEIFFLSFKSYDIQEESAFILCIYPKEINAYVHKWNVSFVYSSFIQYKAKLETNAERERECARERERTVCKAVVFNFHNAAVF